MGKSIKNYKKSESHSPRRYVDKKSSHSKIRNKQKELDKAVRNNDWDTIVDWDDTDELEGEYNY